MKEKKEFSATEVGVLVERLETKIDVVSERVSSLCEDMTEVKSRLTHLETDVTVIKDTLRITLPDHTRRIARLESKVGI